MPGFTGRRPSAQAAADPSRYWAERLAADFSLAGAGRAGVGLGFNRWAYRVRRRVLLRALRTHGIAPSGMRILDLGFGTGFYLDLWRALGAAHVTGFDVADVAVRAARERFAARGWRFEQADLRVPLPLGADVGAYDMVTAFDVLVIFHEHVWHAALDTLASALKPGGYAIVSNKLDRGARAAGRVRRHSREEYEQAFAARGLAVLDVAPIFFFMNSPTDVGRLSGPVFSAAWWLAGLPYRLARRAGCGEIVGSLTGAALCGPELLLGRVFATGPSTKLLLARKRIREPRTDTLARRLRAFADIEVMTRLVPDRRSASGENLSHARKSRSLRGDRRRSPPGPGPGLRETPGGRLATGHDRDLGDRTRAGAGHRHCRARPDAARRGTRHAPGSRWVLAGLGVPPGVGRRV
jgi:2-polyprenyl-3-methyl-5-hydroxy-6-metoxy-1,4-benzoquinol methylase